MSDDCQFKDCAEGAGCPCSGCEALRSQLEWMERAAEGAVCAFCIPNWTATRLPLEAAMIEHMGQCEKHPHSRLVTWFHQLTADYEAYRERVSAELMQMTAERDAALARVTNLRSALALINDADARGYSIGVRYCELASAALADDEKAGGK